MPTWTKEEILFLKESADKLTVFEVAQKLNRTDKSVKHRASELKINLVDGRLKPKLNMGDTFGLFIVTGTTIKIINSIQYLYYICKCQCGRIKHVPKSNLTNGTSKSCGCLSKAIHTLPPGETSLNEKFASCRQSAEIRNLSFNITKEQFYLIVSKNCHYCGRSPSSYNRYVKNDGSHKKSVSVHKIPPSIVNRAWTRVNSIDRIDNNKGYIIDNCVPCCWPCNEMKMDRTVDAFFDQIFRIAFFQFSKLSKVCVQQMMEKIGI